MTCTHCGAPSTQPSGPCATCAPPTAWPPSDGDDAPSGLVAPPKYDETAATPDLQEPPSGLPQLGAVPAPHIEQADPRQYEPATAAAQLPAFAPPPPADPHLIAQYNAALPATNAPTYAPASDEDTVPLPSAASVAAHYSTATVSATAQYTAGVPATSPVAAQYTAAVSATAAVPGQPAYTPTASDYGTAPVTATAQVPGQPAYAPATGEYSPAANAQVPGQYGTAPAPATDPVTGQYSAAPTAPDTHAPAPYSPSAHTPAPGPYGVPAPQYAQPGYAAAPPAPPYGAPSPYHLPYQAGFPDQAPAGPASSVLSIVAIVLAAFAFTISFFVSPLVPAAGAVVCASIGLRRGERLAKLGLILGIVATVYGVGILALNVIALVLL